MNWINSFELNPIPNKWQLSPVLDGNFFKISHQFSLDSSYFSGTIAQAEIDEDSLVLHDLIQIQATEEIHVIEMPKPGCFQNRRLAFKANPHPLLAAGQSWNWNLSISVGLGELSSSNSVVSEMQTIISKDNNWFLGVKGNYYSPIQGLLWSSAGSEADTGSSATGTLKIGYFTTKNKLHCLFIGGGQTNGSLKLIKIRKKTDNNLLLDTNLLSVLGQNTDVLKACIIDTSAFSGQEVYLELADNDNNGGWGYFGFCPQVFVSD